MYPIKAPWRPNRAGNTSNSPTRLPPTKEKSPVCIIHWRSISQSPTYEYTSPRGKTHPNPWKSASAVDEKRFLHFFCFFSTLALRRWIGEVFAPGKPLSFSHCVTSTRSIALFIRFNPIQYAEWVGTSWKIVFFFSFPRIRERTDHDSYSMTDVGITGVES